jgi:hypothetical protein
LLFHRQHRVFGKSELERGNLTARIKVHDVLLGNGGRQVDEPAGAA